MELILEDVVRCSCADHRITDAQGRWRDAEAFYAGHPVARKLESVIRNGFRFEYGRFRIEGLNTAEPGLGEYCFWSKDLAAQLLSPRELSGICFTLHRPHALPSTYWQDDICRTLRKGFSKVIPAHLLREEC